MPTPRASWELRVTSHVIVEDATKFDGDGPLFGAKSSRGSRRRWQPRSRGRDRNLGRGGNLVPADAVFSLEDLTTRLGSHRNNTACGAVSMA
jgi:hypothetical protein